MTPSRIHSKHRIGSRGWDMGARYIYKALDSSKKQIRLLERTSMPHEATAAWRLKHYDIEDAPEYRALSYAWGTAENAQPFVLEDGVVMIRQNLAHFFRDVGNRSDLCIGRCIWIDQICIQQDSVHERNHQVAMMADVYKNAVEVVVWLGPANETTPDLLEVFGYAVSSDSRVRHNTSANGPVTPDVIEAAKLTEPYLSAIEDFYRREYWSRLWPVQELLLASDLVVYVGKHEFVWENFSEIDRKLQHVLPEARRTSGLMYYAYNLLNIRNSAVPDLEYLVLVENFRDNRCTDPRDKLYALINLLPEASRPNVNYSLGVNEVYGLAVRLALETYFHGLVLSESWLVYPLIICIYLAEAMGVVPKDFTESRSDANGRTIEFNEQVVKQSWPVDRDPKQNVPEAEKTDIIEAICTFLEDRFAKSRKLLPEDTVQFGSPLITS